MQPGASSRRYSTPRARTTARAETSAPPSAVRTTNPSLAVLERRRPAARPATACRTATPAGRRAARARRRRGRAESRGSCESASSSPPGPRRRRRRAPSYEGPPEAAYTAAPSPAGPAPTTTRSASPASSSIGNPQASASSAAVGSTSAVPSASETDGVASPSAASTRCGMPSPASVDCSSCARRERGSAIDDRTRRAFTLQPGRLLQELRDRPMEDLVRGCGSGEARTGRSSPRAIARRMRLAERAIRPAEPGDQQASPCGREAPADAGEQLVPRARPPQGTRRRRHPTPAPRSSVVSSSAIAQPPTA